MQKSFLVFAYSELGYDCLKFLIEQNELIVGVFTHEDAAQEKIWFPSVKKLAIEYKLPVFTEENLKTPAALQKIQALKPDLIFSFYYRNLIPAAVLNSAPLGAYNMHGSLLPKYRGRAPVNWAVLHGEREAGPTLHVMVEKADAGDIIDQQSVPIGPNDTSHEVQLRVNKAAVEILKRQIDKLKGGTAVRIKQDATQATVFGRRKPEDGKIDWKKPSNEIHNLIRAVTHPFPGAYTDLESKKTYIWRSRLTLLEATELAPGQFSIQNDHLFIACGDGLFLEILQAQRDGSDEMGAAEFCQQLMKDRQETTKK